MRNLETIPFGYMEIETYCPDYKRETFEKIRCRTEGGQAEFIAEVKRVERIRAGHAEWAPVVIRLVHGETEHERSLVS